MSRIEWTERTWNPWTGCTRVSPGCDHCYMFRNYPGSKQWGSEATGTDRTRCGSYRNSWRGPWAGKSPGWSSSAR